MRTRYIKLENLEVPTGKFAISGLRIFGKGVGDAPAKVEDFEVLRGNSEPRNAWIKWKAVDGAIGYHVLIGTEPDKLYTSVMVYGQTEYTFRAMSADETYYFAIQGFNENGVAARSEVTQSGINID